MIKQTNCKSSEENNQYFFWKQPMYLFFIGWSSFQFIVTLELFWINLTENSRKLDPTP